MRKKVSKILILALLLTQCFGSISSIPAVYAEEPETALVMKSDGWKSVYPLNGQFDPKSDQQTGSGQVSQDIVGNAEYPSTFFQFSEDKKEIAIRIRVNACNGTAEAPQFSNFAFVGIDGDNKGCIDFFLGVYNPTGNNGRIGIYQSDPSATNTGPSSTGIIGKPLMAFQPQKGLNYSILPADSSFSAAADSNGQDGTQDYFINFSFKLSDINNAIHAITKKALTFNADTPFQFITGTAAQDNSFNQDINGMDKSGWKSGQTWTNMGAFSPIISANPQPIALYNVIFDKNTGDTEASPAAIVLTSGSAVGTLPEAPVKRAMYFQEWNTKSDGSGNTLMPDTKITSDLVDENKTLRVYAIWGNALPVLVTFDANGGNWSSTATTAAVNTINGMVGDNTPETPTKGTDYFIGWASSKSANASDYDSTKILTAPCTYYALWAKQANFSLTFCYNKSGTDNSFFMKAYSNNGGQFSNNVFPQTASRTGYTFGGWYDNRGGSGTAITAYPSKLTSDLTYYAKWSPASYIITYDANAGTDAVSGLPAAKTVNDGKFGIPASVPERTGYQFVEWNKAANGTGEPMYDSSDITGNVTVFAIWKSVREISFDGNGGTFGGDTTSITNVSAIGNRLSEMPQPPAKEEYTFAGWSRTQSGTTPEDLRGDMTGVDTLYAIWKPIDTVSFDQNEGYPNIIAKINTAYGGVLYLPGTPAREGYDFTGWNTKIDGSGDAFTTMSNVSGSITVFAQWQLEQNMQEWPALPKPTEDGIAINSITVTLGAITLPSSGVEYAIARADGTEALSDWQDSPAFDGLSENTEYIVYVRAKADSTHPTGQAVASDPIRTLMDQNNRSATIAVPQVNGKSPLDGSMRNPVPTPAGITVNLPNAEEHMKAGFTFTGWVVSSGGITITNPTSTNGAFFIMGDENVIIEALYAAKALTFVDKTLSGAVNELFSYSVTAATGGSGNYTYTHTLGTLPGGITFTNGVFSGTPSGPASNQVTIVAADAVTGATAAAVYTLNVAYKTGTLSISCENITYGGILSPAVLTNPSGGTVTYEYKPRNAADGEYSLVPPVNAGEYTMRATAAAANGYDALTATADFAIQPKGVTLTADDKYVRIGGELPAFTYTVSGYISGEGPNDVIQSPPAISCDADTNVEGPYTISLSGGVTKQNYRIASRVDGTLTVSDKTPVIISGFTTPDRPYNGQEYAPQGTVSTGGDYALEDLEYLYESTDGEGYFSSTPPTSAGAYKLTVKVPEADANYVGSQVYTFDIQKIIITIVPQSAGKIQGTSDPAFSYAYEPQGALIGADVFTGTLGRNAGEAPGAYDYTLGSLAVSGNYTLVLDTANKFTITAEALTGVISGIVINQTEMNLPITVSVELGNKRIDSMQTGQDGRFMFTGLPDGYYNVVATNGLFTETRIAEIKNGILLGGEIQFVLGRIKSIVQVNPNTPDIAVGGLHELFATGHYTQEDQRVVQNGGTVEIRLIAEGKDEGDIVSEVTLVKGVAGSDEILLYLDLQVEKSVYDYNGNETSRNSLKELEQTIRIVVPLPDALAGKQISIYRVHNGAAHALSANPSDPEHFTISDGYAILVVKRFSIYAFGIQGAQGERESMVGRSDVSGPASPETGKLAEEAKEAVSKVLNTDEHRLYAVGYPDGEFKPDNNLTRAEAAMMLYNLLRNQQAEGEKAFSDVKTGRWYQEAVITLANLGVIEGYPDGTYKPNAKITRAEFTAILVRFANIQASGEAFADVSPKHWAYNEISCASAYGWVKGYPDQSFKPNNGITRAEAVTILNGALDRRADKSYQEVGVKLFPDVSAKFWAFYDILEATNSHDYAKDAEGESWSRVY